MMLNQSPVHKKLAALLLLGFLFFLPRSSLFAQTAPDSAVTEGSLRDSFRRGDYLTLKIAVIGPGDELYFWWGHIGLIVEDRISGQARFYDWGVFSFDNENFFVNFAFGRLLYSCMVSPAEYNFNGYVHTNRDITLYTLDLPADKKEAILRFAENNMLPENRDYNYHHFRDNCATRIRDIIDMALDGQLKAEFGNAPGRFTLRQHVRRHTWFNPLIDWALNFWMGQGIDRPIMVWDDMFLPSEIGVRIRGFHFTDSHGMNRPLVSSVEVINTSSGRPEVLDIPRLQWPRELIASLLFSTLLTALYLLWGRKNGFRIFIGLTQSFLGLFFGIAGSVLFFMSFFTDHDYTYHNSNIFFVNPLFFLAIPLGLVFAFTKNTGKRFVTARLLRVFWVYVLIGGLFSMVIKLFPAFYQQNQVTQALVLPVALHIIIIMFNQGRLNREA